MNSEMAFLKNKRERYNNARSGLEWLIQDKVADKRHIPTIKVMVRKFKNMQEKIQKEIDLFQEKCTHKFEYAGHGHNYDFYDCTECGKSEER